MIAQSQRKFRIFFDFSAILRGPAQDCAIFKTGERKYRCQFFFRVHQQYGTGVFEYDDLAECTVSLLQAQADHVAQERGDLDKKRR